MEILEQYWWVLPVAFVICAIAIPVRIKHANKRRAVQYKQDESLIQHFAEDLSYEERNTYKELPNRIARMAWLTKHYPEFIAAVERHYPDTDTELVIAHHVDVRILDEAMLYDKKDVAVRCCFNEAINSSLSDYQSSVDERNERSRVIEAERREREQRMYEARQKQLQAERAEAEARKKAAKEAWESLTPEQKTAFRKAKGRQERERILPNSTKSDAYPVEVLYAAIMATEFSNVNSNHSNSIEYCESSSTSSHGGGYGGHHDSGGYSGGYDGGSSSSDSGSCGGGE